MRKNKVKLGLSLLTVLATPIAVNAVASSDAQAAQGWVKTGNAWYFYNQKGTLVRNAWAGSYWLGADGKMATNAWVDNGRYYVGANGAWVKGAQNQATATQNQVTSNATKQGWVQSGNAWYYYNNGSLVVNKWAGNYWLGADGRMATNSWVDNNRYYVGNDGAWVKDAKRPEEKKTGWVKEANTWYYYNTDGTLARNKWAGNYWLGADGRMATNRWVDNNRYYVGNDGAWVKDAKRQEEKKTGWVKESNVWYYYNTDGTLARNKWAGNYWLGADGKMATNSWVDNGRYYVGSNGAWIPNYSKGDNKTTAALNMPQYYQGDYRWRNKRFGIGTMAQSGCAPTSLAMVFSGLGQKVLPTSVAETIYNHTNEMNVRELGTSGKGVVYAINAYGYSYSVITSKEQLIAALQSGKPVFAAVGNGIFARGGLTHAIVLSGYSNGKTKAMDPDNVNTTGRWYDVNTIWNQRSTDPYDTSIGGAFVQIG
ncbi:C39 family peptidase [Gemella taiwanensis]